MIFSLNSTSTQLLPMKMVSYASVLEFSSQFSIYCFLPVLATISILLSVTNIYGLVSNFTDEKLDMTESMCTEA